MLEGQITSDPVILKIRKCWNFGDTKEETFKWLYNRYGTFDQEVLNKEWERLKRLFGDASLPIDYLNGYETRIKTSEELYKENAQMVGSMAYGDWKGATGKGKELKKMIKNNCNKKD